MKSFGKLFRAFTLGCAAMFSLSANAFMPAAGVWTIDSEENGQPGRGFQLDVQNEVVIFYYNGYRADGSSVFYVAFGPMANNVFASALREFRGGTILGAPRKNAAEVAGPGNVSITFSSGTRGSITFPGEPAKAITKFNFGYPQTQDGLLGTYLLAYATPAGVIGDKYTLSRKLGPSQLGNGVVTDANGTIACENMTKDALAGAIACTELSGQAQNDDLYMFRMAGDRGTGTGSRDTSEQDYPLEVWRTATASGKSTGLNEGTADSVEKLTEADSTAEQGNYREARKNAAQRSSTTPILSASQREALTRWAREAAELARRAN